MRARGDDGGGKTFESTFVEGGEKGETARGGGPVERDARRAEDARADEEDRAGAFSSDAITRLPTLACSCASEPD